MIIPIVLQIVGVLIIMAEIILPSGGILSILAASAFAYSLYLVFTDISTAAGFGFVLADLIIIPTLVIVGFKFLAKSPIALRKKLSSDTGVTSQKRSLRAYIGLQGVAMTDLRPSGIAVFNKERLDVVTEGKYLDKGTPIEVISVTGNQIIVKET